MRQPLRNKNILFFWGIEFILFLSYLLVDLFFSEHILLSSVLKYSSIIICFFFTLHTTYLTPCKKTIACLLAILFTLAADYFLLFTPLYSWGVLCFLLVQTLYFYYCEQLIGQFTPFVFAFRILLRMLSSLLVTLVLMFVGFQVNILIFITFFYLLSFIDNIFILSINHKKNLFLWGMLLFFACDLSVGLYNLPDYINLSASYVNVLHQLFGILMWTFYLPGQVFMATGIRQDSLMQ